MKKRIGMLFLVLFLAAQVLGAEQATTGPGLIRSPVPGYFDNAFFAALNYIYSKLNIFQGAAYKLARIGFMLDVLILCIYMALGLSEVYKELVSRLVSLGIVLGVMSAWSFVYMQVTAVTLDIANMPVKMAIGSSEDALRKEIFNMYEEYAKAKKEEAKIKENALGKSGLFGGGYGYHEGEKESEKIQDQIDTLMRGMGNLRIWAKGTEPVAGTSMRVDYSRYLRPEAILLYTTALLAPAWAEVQSAGLDIGKAIITGAMVLLSFVLGSLITIQYIIAMLEWAMIGCVGILMVPMGLFKGTKYLTERLIATVVGHIIKIIVMYFVIGLVTGIIFKLGRDVYFGTMDQVLRIIFSYFMFYMMVTNVPSMAQGFMSGSPSLSMASAAQTAASAAQVSRSASSASNTIMSSSYHAAHAGLGAAGSAVGAALGVRDQGGSRGQAVAAAGKSLAGSVYNSVMSASTDKASGMLGGSVFSRGGAGGGGGPGGGGGIQDAADAQYASERNPYSSKMKESQHPTMGRYFMSRLDEGRKKTPPPPSQTSQETTSAESARPKTIGGGVE